jgi:hypothetical protein
MRRAMTVGFALALLVAACGNQTPTTPATPRTASPQPSAGDLPAMDPVAIFGPGVKLTGTDESFADGVLTGAVLDQTGHSFGVAAECRGHGILTIEVSQRTDQSEPAGLPWETIATYRVPCPTTVAETFKHDTGEVGPKSSLNVTVQSSDERLQWRAILVDLRP